MFNAIARSLFSKLLTGVLGLTVGTGIACLQDGFRNNNSTSAYTDGSNIWGLGVPFVAGVLTALMFLVLWLSSRRLPSLEVLAVASTIALVAGVAVVRLPMWYPLIIPPIVLVLAATLVARSDTAKISPKVARFAVVLVLSALIGGGAGYWEAALAWSGSGTFDPNRSACFVDGLIGLLFAAIAGPFTYALIFSFELTTEDAALIAGAGLFAGCLAALSSGGEVAAAIFSVFAVIVTVLLMAKRADTGAYPHIH